MTRSSFRPGQLVHEKFRLNRELGRGSMGMVFAATDIALRRDVAIKFMLPEMATNGELCARFLLEARAAAGLRGRNVTHVYDVGRLSIGLPYIVMELLEGEAMDRLLADKKPQTVPVAVDFVLQVCLALAEAHARGIVHRDLKPANLFVDRAHRRPLVKVLDFGIARLRDGDGGKRLTLPNQIVGTPLYMAPEQRLAATDIDHRADIFALGAILYELLVGYAPSEVDEARLPYVSTEAAAQPKPCLPRSLAEPPVPPHQLRPSLPRGLSQAVVRCLELERTRRFDDVAVLAEGLASFGDADAQALAFEVVDALRSPPHSSIPVADAPPFSLLPPDMEPDGARHTEPIPFSREQQAYEELSLSTQATLLSALAYRAQRQRQITFLLGSGLTAPTGDRPGVPSVKGMIDLVRSRYRGQELLEFNSEIRRAPNPYQQAFGYLLATRGADSVNEVIREAVLKARLVPAPEAAARGDRRACRALEEDLAGWVTSPALEGLGNLVARAPEVFGDVVLTSNFDPLIEVAIKRAGGKASRTVLHGDGALQRDANDGCHVIHFHGDWFRTDTLHTPTQLWQPRPKLVGSLARLLNERTLVVLGYGGWDDVFTRGLIDAVARGGDGLDVLWAFNSPDRSYIVRKYGQLFDQLREAVARGRVLFYLGVVVHSTLSDLCERMFKPEQRESLYAAVSSSQVRATARDTRTERDASSSGEPSSKPDSRGTMVSPGSEPAVMATPSETDEKPTLVYSKR